MLRGKPGAATVGGLLRNSSGAILGIGIPRLTSWRTRVLIETDLLSFVTLLLNLYDVIF